MYEDDELLPLSGIQHYAFCPRQWALIHIEQQWADNLLTVEGDLVHGRAHNEALRERRGSVLTVRGLAVASRELGLNGKCDVVEFHQAATGHPLFGEEGLWQPVPVEYKRGRPKVTDADRLQLCAQALCLEEMLGCDVREGFLYYHETRARERVACGDELRDSARRLAAEMHALFDRRHTPKVKSRPGCRSCSLKDLCLTKTEKLAKPSSYMSARLDEVFNEETS